MRPKVLVLLSAIGFLGATFSAATASVDPTRTVDSFAAQADSTPVKADSTAARPDSTAAMPVAPAAATQAPAPAPTPAPAPASTPPPATAPATAPPPAAASTSKPNDRIYYGGTVTLSFGSTTSIGFFPMVAYKLTPKISGGIEAGYEYVSYGDNQSTHNYGGSVFGRYRVGRNLYAHAEYESMNYEIFTTRNSSERQWVPALLLGGGYVKALSARTSVYAEALWDVLQDENSPYNGWEPVMSVGVAVGF